MRRTIRTHLRRLRSRGPHRRPVVALLVSVAATLGLSVAPAGLAAAATTTCGNTYYPDGKVAFRACVVWENPSGPTWTSYRVYAWNPNTAAGGHTDTFGPVRAHGNGWLRTIDNLTDTETQTLKDGDDPKTEGANTVWVEGDAYTYDDRCYRVFIVPGDSDWDRLTDCSWQ